MTVCWNCGQQLGATAGESLNCPQCHALQPPPENYFDLLGLPHTLSLDTQALQDRFYELTRKLHPDRFTRKSEREKQYSLDASSILNDAYRILRDPVKRAEYFLKQKGFDIGEQRSKDVPPELLEEVFELNMALEEMRGGDDSARAPLELASTNFTQMLTGIDKQLEAQFAAYDEEQNPAVLAQIRGKLNRRKYIQNLVNEVAGTLAA